MARTANPWYWEERQGWYVSIGGQRHFLGEHPSGFPAPRKQRGKWNAPAPIVTYFRALMSPTTSVVATVSLPISDVFERFLDWCQNNRSPRTYEWSRDHIQNFINSLPDKKMETDDLKPFHVQQWVDAKVRWGPNQKRGAITAIQRAFSWAEKMGHILKSPVRNVEKPAAKRREQVLTPSEFQSLLSNVRDDCFRDVLEFCWETGARVQEVRLVEAAHFKPERGRIDIPPTEAKGKKRWRIIYLTKHAEEIVRRLVLKHSEGPIFRNSDGMPWQAQAFNNRFCRLQQRFGREILGVVKLNPAQVEAFAQTLKQEKKVGGRILPKNKNELLREARKKLIIKRATKKGVKYALTAIRHSFATRLLEAGVDHLTVSALMGHADGAMLAKVYSHIGEKTDYLRQELLKASNAETVA
ncbi:MAG: site-specific integrase [Planctomycetes bacterium]|nr:site-specific integrase [Planctomycetota bacterium]